MRRPTGSLLRLAAVALIGWYAGACAAGSCGVSSSGLAFGRYDPLTLAGKLTSSDRNADATVSVVCTALSTASSYTISLGPDAQGNTIVSRYLAHDAGGPGMAFNVYLDAAFTTVWGDGLAGAAISASIPAGDSSHSHTVFGRVPAGQNQLRAGNYSGSLVMTITYNP